jgi:hypothetical protein
LELIQACFTGLWVQSFEQLDALQEIAGLCRDQEWRLATWDIDRGLQVVGSSADGASEAGGSDPLAAIRALPSLATADGTAILVLSNFHRFLGSAEVVQALQHQITRGKHDRTFVVVLAPVVDLPVELEKQFIVVDHELPDRGQIEELARGIATEEGELPDGDALGRVLDAAAGLTRYEAEGAFSLSLVRTGRIEPATIWELKSQALKKSGLVSLYHGDECFDDIGGLEALKAFCTKAMQRQGDLDPLRRPRGVLLLSPPGCGKSAFAKGLGTEVGRPTLVLDVGSLMGSLVGETEGNIRLALSLTDAMAPAVLMIDEVEKAFSGLSSSGQTDSGVSARLFGTFLTWLNDHESDVFVIATCNDISKLPPEFSRAERFDAVVFVDLPSEEQKTSIWSIYRQMFSIPEDQHTPDDTDWTGAEIKACCRLARLLDASLEEAATNVVPVAHTSREAITSLRDWASGRCLSADRPGLFDNGKQNGSGAKRRVERRPSLN